MIHALEHLLPVALGKTINSPLVQIVCEKKRNGL